MTIYILPTKTRGCAPQSPETDENDENGGCLSDKTRVCQKKGFLATRAAIYRSLRALRARNRKKVSKRVFLGVWRKVSKNTRKSLKTPKNTQKGPKIGIFRLFQVFFETPDPKKTLFETFLRFRPGDSCKWRLGSQGFSPP